MEIKDHHASALPSRYTPLRSSETPHPMVWYLVNLQLVKFESTMSTDWSLKVTWRTQWRIISDILTKVKVCFCQLYKAFDWEYHKDYFPFHSIPWCKNIYMYYLIVVLLLTDISFSKGWTILIF
jgi:hypothetical protein